MRHQEAAAAGFTLSLPFFQHAIMVPWWSLMLFGIVLIAGMLRLLTFDFGLPYVEHLDEPNWYLFALEWRDPAFENFAPYLGDPPLYIALNAVVQAMLEAFGHTGLAATVYVLRLMAVVFNLATIVFVALAARVAGGDLAGLVAGAVWGITPVFVVHGILALPDPLVYCLVALALWLAAAALADDRRAHWCIWSAAAGLLAVLAKYPVVSALIPGLLVALVIFRRDRRRGSRYLLAQIALIALVGVFLVLYVDVNQFQNEAAVVRDSGISSLFDTGRIVRNIAQAITPLNEVVFAVFVVLGGVGYLMLPVRRRLNLGVIGLCVVVLVTIPWLASAISDVTESGRSRDVWPATGAAAVILGAMVSQVAYWFPRRWRAGLVLVPLAVLLLPWMQENWQLVQSRSLPDRRVEVRQWFDINLEPGTVLVTEENHKTFNPFWGGISHRHWFDWLETDDLMAHPVEVWREDHGISYMVVPRAQAEAMQQSDAGRAYLDTMLPLRDFFSPPVMRGPEMVVYRLWPMQRDTRVQFADGIVLAGYDADVRHAAADTQLVFRFYWQAATPPTANYSLFVHLTPADSFEVLAQADGAPAVPERPTLTWNAPGETLISPEVVLPVPVDILPGQYTIRIGLYDYTSGQRLAIEAAPGETLESAWTLGQYDASTRALLLP